MSIPLLVAAVLGYLLGSLPFGYLVARAKGVNIFEVGSKNPGATNVRRVLGRGPGNLVFALDAVKGALATGWPLILAAGWRESDAPSALVNTLAIGDVTIYDFRQAATMAAVGLVSALIGHSFSCFTHFRGGKGVATGAGGLLVLFPLGAAVSAAVWGVTALITRYVSLASIAAAVSLPVAALAMRRSTVLIGVSVAIAFFVIARHRANISRLLAGAENKIGQKPTGPKS